MLTAEETETVLVDLWNQVDAHPELAYGRKAFEKLAPSAFNKAAVAKMAQFDQPIKMAG